MRSGRLAALFGFVFDGPAWFTFGVLCLSGYGTGLWLTYSVELWRAAAILYTTRPWADTPDEYRAMATSWLVSGLGFAGLVVFKGCLDGLLRRLQRPDFGGVSPGRLLARGLRRLFCGPAWLAFAVMSVLGYGSCLWLGGALTLWREDTISLLVRPWPQSLPQYEAMAESFLLGVPGFAGLVLCKGCLDGLLTRTPVQPSADSSPTGPSPR